MELYPQSNFVVVGATYQQLREGFFTTLQDVLWGKGLEDGVDFVYRASPRPWLKLLHNNAKIHSWSAEIVGRVRSANVQTLILEEPPTWSGTSAEEAWVALNGRLRHNARTMELYPDLEPQGRLTFNPTNVGPGHWLYELIVKRWPEKGYECLQMSSKENSILLAGDPGYVENLQVAIAPHRWAMEIDGDWATSGGGCYRGYDSGKHEISAYPNRKLPDGLPPFAWDPFKPIDWALDFNYEWMASVVGQWHDQKLVTKFEPQPPPHQPKKVAVPLVPGFQRRILYLFDEIFLNDCGVRDVAARFLELYGAQARQMGVRIYGDASGGTTSQQLSSADSARTNWQIIMECLIKGGIPVSKIQFCVQSRNPPIPDRLNMVNDQFETGEGIGFIMDADKAPELRKDFIHVKTKPGSHEIDKSDKSPSGLMRTHLSDSLGYEVFVQRSRMLGREVKLLDWTSR